MRARTFYRELTAAGLLAASYPLSWIAECRGFSNRDEGTPVVLLHGMGGNRANLLVLAMYLRLAGFTNIVFFEYSRVEPTAIAAEHLADLVDELGSPNGVHLVGHSQGGTIARRFSAGAAPGTVRSLVTLGSPYRYEQQSPKEVAIFGEEDTIVPPPRIHRIRPGAVKRAVILPSTGHLGVLYHAETMRLIESELTANAGL